MTDTLALICSLIMVLCGLGNSKGPLQWYRSEIIRAEVKKEEWELREGIRNG